MNLDADVSWVGYANREIDNLVEPVLQENLRKHGLVR